MSSSPTNAVAPKPKKSWLVPVATVVACIAVVAIIVAKRVWVHNMIHEPVQRQVNLMADRLKAQGVSVGEARVVDSPAGGEQVVEIDISAKPVTLIEFDPAQEPQAKELMHVHEDHKSSILGAEQAAEDNGSIVITGYDKNPAKDKILDAFGKK
jgi:hypothetical protein